MNQYEFGYFPRNKYKDLVFYVKTGEHSNMGLFEMEDTEENRALMDALRSHPYQSERDKVLNLLIKRMKEANNDDPSEWTWQQIIYQIEQVRVELRQQAGEPK
jgi:Leu/Phe-tRNA-protein transferase